MGKAKGSHGYAGLEGGGAGGGMGMGEAEGIENNIFDTPPPLLCTNGSAVGEGDKEEEVERLKQEKIGSPYKANMVAEPGNGPRGKEEQEEPKGGTALQAEQPKQEPPPLESLFGPVRPQQQSRVSVQQAEPKGKKQEDHKEVMNPPGLDAVRRKDFEMAAPSWTDLDKEARLATWMPR